jgi:4-diphosphocytidyl-2-C-methyl-D-erythritol kinase
MNRSAVRVRCPGKINWILKVGGRRPDGFHEVITVLQAIDLWDTLTLHRSGSLTMSCNRTGIPTDGENLVIRAARALARRAGIREPTASIHLEKSIPAGGGLGGGSSDAAGTLLGLDRLWSLGFSRESLAEVGAELGSDVPFFLAGGTALGTGRGERIEPLPFAGKVYLLLGFPAVMISTAEVYAGLPSDLTPLGNGVNLGALRALKLPEYKDFGFAANDLEPVVFDRWPELKSFRDGLLQEGAMHAMLSGSGSTVFGVFEGEDGMNRAGKNLAGRFRHWKISGSRTVADAVRLAT